MPIYALGNSIPVVDPTAFVHPTAVLIGDAIVGPNCYVGPGASMRGDFGRVQLAEGANLQDNCVMHSFPGRVALVDVNGHIGHGAILHGCTVGRDALVGMQAVIMDDAVIGEGAFVAAMSFVKSKEQVPPRVLVAGIPARVMRELSEQEMAWKRKGTEEYQELARRCLEGLRECAPLREIEPDRPQNIGTVQPLAEFRTKKL
jgi:phenylacetic acid degradation protein